MPVTYCPPADDVLLGGALKRSKALLDGRDGAAAPAIGLGDVIRYSPRDLDVMPGAGAQPIGAHVTGPTLDYTISFPPQAIRHAAATHLRHRETQRSRVAQWPRRDLDLGRRSSSADGRPGRAVRIMARPYRAPRTTHSLLHRIPGLFPSSYPRDKAVHLLIPELESPTGSALAADSLVVQAIKDESLILAPAQQREEIVDHPV